MDTFLSTDIAMTEFLIICGEELSKEQPRAEFGSYSALFSTKSALILSYYHFR